MRILFVSEWFSPEPAVKILPFARGLLQRGHQVEALTGFPNYPEGRLYQGYQLRPWQREMMDGIVVNRVPLYPSRDRSLARRFLTYGSFAAAATALGPFLTEHPDVIYAYHPPPSVALPALFLKARYAVPVVYDIQDLWPDTVSSSGVLTNRWLLATIETAMSWLYRGCDQIVVLSPGFKRALVARGVAPDKITVIYNWCDETTIGPRPPDKGFEVAHGLSGRLNVMFVGTMGAAQALDAVITAARLLEKRRPQIQIVFVGDGPAADYLARGARRLALTNTRFIPWQQPSVVGRFLAAADLLLVHLKDDPLFRITIPSKTQACMAAGRPILMAVGGDAADLVRRARAGIVCQPEDPAGLAAAIEAFFAMPKTERQRLGDNGRRFYKQHLSQRVGLDQFEQVFETAVAGRR